MIAERALTLANEHDDEELERSAAGLLSSAYAELGDEERSLQYREQVWPPAVQRWNAGDSRSRGFLACLWLACCERSACVQRGATFSCLY